MISRGRGRLDSVIMGISPIPMILVLGWFFLGLQVQAERYRWLLGDQVGQWNDDASWSLEGIPGPGDEASFSGGNAVVDQARVGTLILFGQLASGRLEVVERAFVSNSRLSLGHQLVFEPGVPVSYDGLNPMRITGGSQIINHGNFEVFAEGSFHFEDGGFFLNQTKSETAATARFVIQLDPMFDVNLLLSEVAGTGARFINEGAEYINRSPGGVNTVDLEFQNNGVVSAEQGTILFKKGGLHRRGAFLTTGTNEVIFAEGEHVFELDQGDIQMGKGIVWSGGDFRLRKVGGRIAAEGLSIRDSKAELRGAGLFEVDNLRFEPQWVSASLEVLDSTHLKIKETALIQSRMGRVIVDGILSFLNPAVVLHHESQLLCRSAGEIRFEGEKGQDLRDLNGVSRIENDGVMKFHAPTNNVLLPFINRGLVEFQSHRAQVTKDFTSQAGLLSVAPHEKSRFFFPGNAEVHFKGKTVLGRGATIAEGAVLKINTDDDVTMQGVFDGKGTIELGLNQKFVTNIEGEASFQGPNLNLERAGTIFFSETRPSSWSVDTTDTCTWDLGTGIGLVGPGTLGNVSTDLKWNFDVFENSAFDKEVRISKMTIENEGVMRLVSQAGFDIDIELNSGTSVLNTGDLILGESARSTHVALSQSSITNGMAASLVFKASMTNRLSDAFFFDRTPLVNLGDIRLDRPGARLILDSVAKHEGSITLNQGTLLFEGGFHTFGRDAKLVAVGAEPSNVVCDGARLIIEDKLSFDGPMVFKDDRGFSFRTLEVPILGHLKAKSIHFETLPKGDELTIQVTVPNRFIPGTQVGKSFEVLQAETLTGLKKEQVMVAEIPGLSVRYGIEITPKSIVVTVLSVGESNQSEFTESFQKWTAENFGEGETRKGANDDPDGDGKTNAFEYATGSNPSVPDRSGLRIEGGDGSGRGLRLVYPRSSTARGVQLKLKQSASINETFEPIDPEELESAMERPSASDPSIIEIELPLELPGASRYFILELEIEP